MHSHIKKQQQQQRYLEVVPKGPGPQHLKEGVVVDVLANIVQVVVFSSGADALLRVGSAAKLGHGVGRIDGVQEDWLELRENGNNGNQIRANL